MLFFSTTYIICNIGQTSQDTSASLFNFKLKLIHNSKYLKGIHERTMCWDSSNPVPVQILGREDCDILPLMAFDFSFGFLCNMVIDAQLAVNLVHNACYIVQSQMIEGKTQVQLRKQYCCCGSIVILINQ